jgi:hypothetical protein
MDPMSVGLILTFAIMVFSVLAPPALVWRSAPRLKWGIRSVPIAVGAILAPGVGGYLLAVTGWLFDYGGECGGWLGETYPCTFSQYAEETLSMAVMLLAVPVALGVLLGIAVLIIQVIRSQWSPGPTRG